MRSASPARRPAPPLALAARTDAAAPPGRLVESLARLLRHLAAKDATAAAVVPATPRRQRARRVPA